MSLPEKLVVDSSVAVKWYVPEKGAAEAASFLSPGVQRLAPDLLASEFGNVLWKKVRRGELTAAEATEICGAFVSSSPVTLLPASAYLCPALEIATRRGCTVYGSLYMALAVAEDCPLATADAGLAGAARDHVQVYLVGSGNLP